ncbi:MAG: zinc metallopeptidase [Thermonemataceae bacterium]
MFWIIFIGFMVISFAVRNRLKSKFRKYSKIALSNGLTGREIAEKMLRDHQIHDVKVTCVPGELTDHYNPANKTVNLSEPVYYGQSAAAAAVAAHECGHAVQHATAYSMLEFRSTLVPVQNVSAKILNFIMLAAFFGGFFLFKAIPLQTVLLIVIGAYTVITLFSLVTLPVEFDASKRATRWLKDTGITREGELVMAKDALHWAAMTYVVAAIGSMAMLAFYVLQFLGAGD